MINNFSALYQEVLGNIVWSELEKTRHELNRKADRLNSDYVESGVILCADKKFEERVTNRAIKEIAYRELFGKKINAKRIVKRAIKYEWCLLYGKEG